MALVQDDVKRLLAYSSISQMGYILLGISSFQILGVSGSMFQYVSHGLGKGILFMVAGAIILQTQASDASGLARIEWWLDGSLVGTQTQSPFNLPWQGKPGSHSLVIKAFDLAGNEQDTPPIQFSVGK